MVFEQNENTCLMSKLLAFLLIISLCASFFAFSASASSLSGSWDGQPLPTVSSKPSVSVIESSGYLASRSPSYSYYYMINSSAQNPVFIVAHSLGSLSNDRQAVTLVLGSLTSFTYYFLNSSVVSENSSASSYKNLFRYSEFTTYISPDFVLPMPLYSSRDEAMAALADICENGIPPAADLHELSYTLAPGNAIYIDISGSDFNDVYLYCKHSYFSSNGSFKYNDQYIGYADSLPSETASYPLAGSSLISWNPARPYDLFGRTNNGSYYSSVNDSNGKYLVISNPAYISNTSALGNPENGFSLDQYTLNGAIDISVDQAVDFKVFGLSSSAKFVDGVSSVDTTTNGSSWSGTLDSSTGTWVTTNDQTGEAGYPTPGGSNSPDSATTSIFDWLQNIANQISSFFSGSVGAISTLVSSASDFFHSLSGLYSWLPSPVYSVLISALIIAITIGVIKVFI